LGPFGELLHHLVAVHGALLEEREDGETNVASSSTAWAATSLAGSAFAVFFASETAVVRTVAASAARTGVEGCPFIFWVSSSSI